VGEIDVRVKPWQDGKGWTCEVSVRDHGSETRHSVTVRGDDLRRLEPETAARDQPLEPERLVRRSFEFLLERESKESILRSFELPVIGRYFPEYEGEIRRRLADDSAAVSRRGGCSSCRSSRTAASRGRW
jgi:hypothetical protein